MLELRPLRYLGRISYALYLWHLPLIVAFGWKVGVPLALVVAALSYRFVELPFLRRRHPARVGDALARPLTTTRATRRIAGRDLVVGGGSTPGQTAPNN